MVWSWVMLVIAIVQVHARGWLRPLVAVITSVVSPVLVALGLRAFLVEAYKIPSAGMWPTLEVQDHIFVTKGWYRPNYGDLVWCKNQIAPPSSAYLPLTPDAGPAPWDPYYRLSRASSSRIRATAWDKSRTTSSASSLST
ncbi:S26 family signal peptidase [Myxococcota bacterium]